MVRRQGADNSVENRRQGTGLGAIAADEFLEPFTDAIEQIGFLTCFTPNFCAAGDGRRHDRTYEGILVTHAPG